MPCSPYQSQTNASALLLNLQVKEICLLCKFRLSQVFHYSNDEQTDTENWYQKYGCLLWLYLEIEAALEVGD